MGWGLNLYELVRIPIRKACNGYYLRWYYNGFHYWFCLPGRYLVTTEGEKYRTIGTRKISMSSGQIKRGEAQAIRTIMNTREVSLWTIAGWMAIRIEPGSVNIYDSEINGTEIEFTAIIGSKEISYTDGYSPVPVVPIVVPNVTYCEVVIGSQVWMCKNWDSNYPGSKVYDNDEANRAVLGGLYTFNQIMSPGFCPTGWHVPTLAEWQTAIAEIGGLAVGGGALKEVGTTNWTAPNTGAVDTYGFTLLPSGQFASIIFAGIGITGKLWTATVASIYTAQAVKALNTSAALTIENLSRSGDFIAVRLLKDTPYIAVTYDDWFLPSKDELNEMYVNLQSFGVGNFDPGHIEYWSSSEGSNPAIYAWCQRYDDGLQNNGSAKGNLQFVRACRSFIAAVGAYSLRDAGPAGGLIFYIDGAGTTYYEAAPSDQSVGYTWSNIEITAIGTTGTAVGTGQANTTAITGQVGHTDSAALLCSNLSIVN